MNACRLTNDILSNIKSDAEERIGKEKLFRDTYSFLQEMAINYKIVTPQRALKVASEVLEVVKLKLLEVPEWATIKNLRDIILNTDLEYIQYSNYNPNPQNDEGYNEKELRKDSRRDFLKEAYGRDYSLSAFAQTQIRVMITNALFVNRDPSSDIAIGCVESIDDLNDNMKSLQELLFQNVVSYIKTKVDLPEDLRLYDDYDEYTGVMEDSSITELINNNLESLDIISKSFNDYRQSGGQLDSAISAYNSWTALKHFDEYVSLIMDDSISYRVNSIGKFINENKYSFSGDSQHTYWDDNDDVKIKETTDRATRLLITSTPIITWDGTRTDRYLDFNDWTHIISSVKALILDNASNVDLLNTVDWNSSPDNSFSEHTNKVLRDRNIRTLDQLIGLIPNNGQELLPVLFDILSNKAFYSHNELLYKGFNSDSLNKIRSINDGMFNGTNSLRELSTSRGNYYSYVAQSALSIYNNELFEYYKDRNGIIKVKTLMDNTLRKLQENVRSNVNNINSHWLINNWGDYATSLDMRVNESTRADEYIPDLRTFSFVIPNTSLKVKVTAGSGTITYFGKDLTLLKEAVMQFVDSTLGLNLRKNYDLQNVLHETNPDYLDLLLDFASRTTFLKYLLNTAFKDGKNVSNTMNDLQNRFKGINTYYGELSLVHGSDSNTLNMIAEAQGVARGLTTSPQVYDSQNKANTRQSFRTLKASYKEQYELLNKKDQSATKDLLIVNTPGLISSLFKFKEYTDDNATSKNPVRMSNTELFMANFVYDFIGGIYGTGKDDLVLKGKVLFTSSVNADKSDSSKILTNLSIAPITNNHPLAQIDPNLIDKPLMKYTRNELITLINYELGGYYQKMVDTVRNDLGRLSPLLAQGLESNFAEFNEWVETNHPETTPSEYLNDLIREFNENHPNDPVELIDITHYRTLKDGKIASNQVMLAQLNKYSTGSENFWNSKEHEMIKLLLDDNFTLNTSDTNLPEFKVLRDRLLNNNWIDQSGNMVLCKVKIENPDGTYYTTNIASRLDAERLWEDDWYNMIDSDHIGDSQQSITINPFLARYNLLDHLITLEFLNTTVGSFTNHPYKGELHTDEFGRNNLFELEATQLEALNKRNVSLTTPVIQFLLNELNGISDEYNIAIIDEYLDTQGNVNGLTREFNAIDAATFIDPMTSILENNSLGGSKVGTTTKPFITAYDYRTGTGKMYKTAGFGLTNANIRNSPDKLRMMWKMTSRLWKDLNGNDWIVDITGRSGLRLEDDRDIPYNDVYYSEPVLGENGWEERYYRIKRTINIGDNMYNVHYVRVSENGDDLVDDNDNIVEEGTKEVIINSNYTLWNYFGGKDSMELKNGKLVHSNASVENCVIAANNLGIKLSDNIKTQADFYQPLKHSNIHYICTKGAVKQGAANLNPKERFSDDKHLTFLRTKLYNAGIVLDKEHDIKEDEVVSISTQAMSSSVLRGRTFNSAHNMYRALGLLSNLNAGDHVEIARKLFKNPDSAEVRQEFDEVFNKSVMQSLLRDSGNYNNFAQVLALNIIDRTKRDGNTSFEYKDLKIPLSDGTIYNRVLTSINSYLTSVGIRTKLPGVLAILAPSHNLYKIYAGKKWGEYVNPEEELKVIQENTAPVYLKVVNEDGTFNTSISNLSLNRTYNIEEILPDGSIEEVLQLIATPTQYMALKDNIRKGLINKITENVLVGRNLSSYNIKFRTNSGEDFQLYDLDSIRALYELEEINGDEREKFNKYIALADRWSEISEGVSYLNILYFDRIMRGEIGEDLLTPNFCKEFNSLFHRAARKVLDKWKQFDLNNLSKEISEDGKWYQELLNDKDDSANWYEEYGLKINIKFGLANGDEIKLLNESQRTITGENISSKGSEFAKRLTNQGNAETVTFRGKEFLNAEHAYQSWKTGEFNEKYYNSVVEEYKKDHNTFVTKNREKPNTHKNANYWLMTQILEEKLRQHPDLVEGITQRGGEEYLEKSTHSVTGDKFWESEGENMFLNALVAAYRGIIKENAPTQSQSTSNTSFTPIRVFNGYNQDLLKVNNENFDKINALVQKWIDGISKIKVSDFDSEGNRTVHEHTVDKESIDELAYEIIMPLTFGKQFGLTINSNVSDIVNDNTYFVKQLIDRNSTKTNAENYTIELKVNSGDHLYVLDKNSISNTNLTKVENPLISEEAGSRYKVDLNGNIQYELDNSAELYTDEIGNEIIVTDNIKFYIDNQDYYSIKLSRNLIGNDDLFREVLLAMHNSINDVAYNVANESVKGTNGTESIIRLNNNINEPTGDPDSLIYKRGMAIYNSFMEALNVIVARTPGQSMQSFMAMKIAGFDDSGTNLAYVSTMLNLLQGSDYDIDSVSIFTYDINRNGTIQLWSPYANLTTTLTLKASEKIELPTGLEIKSEDLKESSKAEDYMYIIQNYAIYDDNAGCLRFIHKDDNFIDISIDTSTPERIKKFNLLLGDINNGYLVKPTDVDKFVSKFNDLFPKVGRNQVKIYGEELVNRETVINNMYDLIVELINKHNMFLVNSSKSRRTKIINNYLIANQLNIIRDASNLEQSQAPTDYITEPLKDIADNTSIARKMRGISSGNVMGKFRSYTQSVVGKEDVGIAAVGMKTFAGLTEYYDYVLNSGTPELQQRLLFKELKFNKGGVAKRLLANAYALDLNSIRDIDVLRELAKMDNMDDAALTLAAIASLAADNAKDLKLGKLNAGTATIGMYLYGVMIGKPFKLIAELLTSETGILFAKLLQGNVFTDDFGFSTADKVADYFLKRVDKRFLSKYDTTRGINGKPLTINPLGLLEKRIRDIAPELKMSFTSGDIEYLLTEIARSESYTKERKIELINRVRNASFGGEYERELYNLLCDFVENYINTIEKTNTKDIYDLKILAEGSQEVRELGQLYSTNQRIDTSTDKFLRQTDNIRKAIINRIGKKKGHDVDIIKFIFDSDYRNKEIESYDTDKHTFNILEAPFVAPHYTAYMESLATALIERRQSYKFRTMLDLLNHIELSYNIDTNSAIRGINNYLDDLTRNQWMMQTRLILHLPKDSKVFTNDGEVVTTGDNIDVLLGTDPGNASFRLFMESVIIPDLKNTYTDNNFILDLELVSVNRTVTRNSVPLYSLGINMMPRGDFENAILDNYKRDFNSISGEYYKITDEDGNVLQNVLIGDLFTYYGMIAHGWKINERSLVPILLDYQANSELSRSYQEFQAACDKIPDILEYNTSDLIPYIAQVRSPYRSNDPFIYSIDRRTGRYKLMERMSKSEEESYDEDLFELLGDYSDEYERNSSVIGEYVFLPQQDIRYIPTGKIRGTARQMYGEIDTEEGAYGISFEYDIGNIEGLSDKSKIKVLTKPLITFPDGEIVKYEDFKGEAPIKKQDGAIMFDLKTMLNDYLNLC